MYESFKCRQRWFPAAGLVCTDHALCDASAPRDIGLRQLGADTCSFQEISGSTVLGLRHTITLVRIVYEQVPRMEMPRFVLSPSMSAISALLKRMTSDEQ